MCLTEAARTAVVPMSFRSASGIQSTPVHHLIHNWQTLAKREIRGPRLVVKNVQPIAHVIDIEMIRANAIGEFIPGKRR